MSFEFKSQIFCIVSVIHVCEWQTRSCLSQPVDNVADQYVKRLWGQTRPPQISNQSKSISNIFNHSHFVQVFLMSMETPNILRCGGLEVLYISNSTGIEAAPTSTKLSRDYLCSFTSYITCGLPSCSSTSTSQRKLMTLSNRQRHQNPATPCRMKAHLLKHLHVQWRLPILHSS